MTPNERTQTLHQGVVELRNRTALKERLTADVSEMAIEDVKAELVELYNHSFSGYSICVCSRDVTNTRKASANSILQAINTKNQSLAILTGAGDLVRRNILLKTMRDYFKESNNSQVEVGIAERDETKLREKLVGSLKNGRVLVLQIEHQNTEHSNIILVDANGSTWLIEPCDKDEQLRGWLNSIKNQVKNFQDELPEGSTANGKPVCTLAAWFAVAMFVHSGGQDFGDFVRTFRIGTHQFYALLLLFGRELFLRLALNMTNKDCVRHECAAVLKEITDQMGTARKASSATKEAVFKVHKRNGGNGRTALMNISIPL